MPFGQPTDPAPTSDVDQDEQARRELEQEEFERDLAEIDEVDLDGMMLEVERFERAARARDARGEGLSFRAIGRRLGCSASTARRLLA